MNRRSYRLSCFGSGNSMWGRKHTIETIAKIRQSKLGAKLNPEHIESLRLSHLGKSSGMLGKSHSFDTREKMRQNHLGSNNPFFGKKHSLKIRAKLRKSHLGSNNPNWHGGCTTIYPPEFNNQYREMIRQRDNYICQLCNLPQNGRRLSVHHIDHNKQNLDTAMKISLHASCMAKVDIGNEDCRLSYRMFFEELQRQRGILL